VVLYWFDGMTKRPMESFGKVGWDHTQHTFGHKLALPFGLLRRKTFDALN